MLRKLEISSGRVGLSCAPLPYLYLCIVTRVKGKSFSRENKSLVYVNLHSTVAQKCHDNFNFVHGNFNFTHGNFNLFTAISIYSRQFQFAHGNFNLFTGISIYSRQFQFFNGNAHGIFRFAHHLSHLSTLVADSGHQKSNAKSKVDI